MAGTDQQTGGKDQERESPGSSNEQDQVIIQGECHSTVDGQLYAVRLVFPGTAAHNLASLENVLSGVLELSGLECRVSLGPTSRGAAWDADHRV